MEQGKDTQTYKGQTAGLSPTPSNSRNKETRVWLHTKECFGHLPTSQPSLSKDQSVTQVLSSMKAEGNRRTQMHTLPSFPLPVLSTHGGTLGQLLRGCYLDIEVFGLRLPSGFDEPLQYLVGGKRELEGHRQ